MAQTSIHKCVMGEFPAGKTNLVNVAVGAIPGQSDAWGDQLFQFTTSTEGWIEYVGPEYCTWTNQRLEVEGPVGELVEGIWALFPDYPLVAITGATFSATFYFPGNTFWRIRILYDGGVSFDQQTGTSAPTPNPGTITATVSAGNNGKDIYYFELRAATRSTLGAAYFDDAAMSGFQYDGRTVICNSRMN